MFIPLMRFLLQSLVSRSFLIYLRYSFLIFFFFIHLFNGVCFQYSQVLIIFFFSEHFDFSWLGSSIPSVIYLFPILFMSMAHFSIVNFIPISWLYILIVCIRVSNFVSFFANGLMPSLYILLLSLSTSLKAFADGFSQGCRTPLSILPDLNNAVVWMVCTCPLISRSSSSLTN